MLLFAIAVGILWFVARLLGKGTSFLVGLGGCFMSYRGLFFNDDLNAWLLIISGALAFVSILLAIVDFIFPPAPSYNEQVNIDAQYQLDVQAEVERRQAQQEERDRMAKYQNAKNNRSLSKV